MDSCQHDVILDCFDITQTHTHTHTNPSSIDNDDNDHHNKQRLMCWDI